MSASNVFETILRTIEDVQQKNKANKNEPTADKTVFDLLKGKLKDLDQKTKEKRTSRGKSPQSILDLIRKEIEGVRRTNKKDANVETAPKSVFDNILKKVEEGPKRQASTGLRKIVEDYNLDISRLPRDLVGQVQQKYIADRKNFDKQYAQAIYDLIKRTK